MGYPHVLVTALLCCLTWEACVTAPSSPNIVLIVADDLGWNDVGFHNKHIQTPNIDRLVQEGILLDQNYVQPLCSPSRAALMTGVYPFRMGLQHSVILPEQAVCVPLNRTLLPQHLKTKGYKTHMVGKWHLGFCNWNCTPTYRGFDSFYGYYNAQEDYYTKESFGAFDFRNNENVDNSVVGNYSAPQYVRRIQKIIKDHDTDSPLFMYLPFQNCHDPLEVPEEYYDKYPYIHDEDRRTFAGMVTALDDAVGEVVKALKDKGLDENTLIVFTTDNGGWVSYGGNNYPLRGGKFTVFEGGTRAISFVHGSMFKETGVKYEGLMHITDWLPTLTEAAGIVNTYTDIDGVSQWQNLLNVSKASPRSEVVYNLDYSAFPVQGRAAIRIGDYKLVDGFPGIYPSWYPPKGEDEPSQPRDHPENQSVLRWTQHSNSIDEQRAMEELLLHGPRPPLDKFLFNLKDDPNEHKNLYLLKPKIVQELKERLDYHKTRMVDPNYPENDPKADPDNWGGAWTPGWC